MHVGCTNQVEMESTAPGRSERHAAALLALLALGGLAACAPTQTGPSEIGPTPYELSPRLYRAGDDPSWAGVTGSEGWSRERPRDSPSWWFFTTLHADRDASKIEDLALRVFAPGAMEVYWDGALVGRNGVVGSDRLSERPGRHGVWMPIDAGRVTAGEHRIAVRVSSHHIRRVFGPIGVQLANRGDTETKEARRAAGFLFCAGVLVLAGVVFISLYRTTGARIDTLLFATLTLAVAVLLTLEYSKFLWAYPYPWHMPRLVAISCLTIAVGTLLPLFVAAHLGLGRLRMTGVALVLAYFASTLVFTDPDLHSLLILRAAVGVAFAAAAFGVWRRQRDAGWILAGLAVNLVPAFATGLRYADHWFFVGFLAMVGVLLALMARTLRRQADQHTAALLTAEQLRYELLRKTIQPHFLMNSLAASISQIEEQPESGVELLRNLAEELQVFLRIGEKNRTTVREELDLCRKHVRTMAQLTDRPLELHVEGDNPSDALPPGVLLTLVENAITHGDLAADPRIQVVVSREAGDLTIEVRNRVADTDEVTRPGAGLSYVRAQLKQAEGRWEFADQRHAGEWTARIVRRGDGRTR